MLSMKLSFFGGIILAFPLLLLFILQFVLPGLHRHEKRLMWPAMAIGFGLFLGGVLFAYYAVLPRALAFFYDWSGNLGVSNDWRIGEYISFATTFTLLFGLSFELPVVVMVFVKLGLLTYDTMSNTRSYAILAIFVAAAVLTPTPDILTMLLMAAPMIILYEICIWLAWFDRRKHRMQEEQEAREREEQLLAMPPVDIEVQRQKDALVADPWHDDYHDHVYDEEHHHGLEDDGAKKDSDGIDDVGITKGLPSPEAAEDGWVTEYPQQDYHDSELPQTDEIPEIPLPKDAVTEAKVETDSDKKPDDDKKE